VPLNKRHKCVGEYKIAQKVDSSWLNMFHIHALKEYLNLYNKNQHVSITSAIIIKVALQE